MLYVVILFTVVRHHGSYLPLQRGPCRVATRCPPSCARPRLHVWGKAAGERYVGFQSMLHIHGVGETTLFLWSGVQQLDVINFVVLLNVLQLYSKKMAAIAGKALLRKEEVWLCGCSERRHATRACPQDHQGPWRHDQQKVSPWQEGVPRVKIHHTLIIP